MRVSVPQYFLTCVCGGLGGTDSRVDWIGILDKEIESTPLAPSLPYSLIYKKEVIYILRLQPRLRYLLLIYFKKLNQLVKSFQRNFVPRERVNIV